MSISGTKKDRLRERLRKSNTVKNLAKKRIAEIANNLSTRINRLERQLALADILADEVNNMIRTPFESVSLALKAYREEREK